MEILTSVRGLYIRFKSLVNDFVYSFGRAALLLLVAVQNHTVPVRELRRIRVNLKVKVRHILVKQTFLVPVLVKVSSSTLGTQRPIYLLFFFSVLNCCDYLYHNFKHSPNPFQHVFTKHTLRTVCLLSVGIAQGQTKSVYFKQCFRHCSSFYVDTVNLMFAVLCQPVPQLFDQYIPILTVRKNSLWIQA